VDLQEIEAWQAAAAELGISVEFRDDAVVVRDFGSDRGMLCAIRSGAAEVEGLRLDAEREGMGWSALGPEWHNYDRAVFVEAFSDWGWTGAGDPPAWYTGELSAE
jgi:hypothetical protein